jgi:hypothetical protein
MGRASVNIEVLGGERVIEFYGNEDQPEGDRRTEELPGSSKLSFLRSKSSTPIQIQHLPRNLVFILIHLPLHFAHIPYT